MPRARVTAPHTVRVYTRGELVTAGWTSRALRDAVHDGRLLRPREGSYLVPTADAATAAAVGAGGRLTCVSELRRLGVFVRETPAAPHVHLEHSRSRLPAGAAFVRRHWRALARAPHPRAANVALIDALIHAVHCEPPRDAVASVDSALNLGLLRVDEVDEIFAHVDLHRRILRGLIDGRAESGCETLVRLMLRALGARVEPQVSFRRVGRVDLLVDGWLVIECDSEEFHSDWEAQRRDRRRDQELATQGLTVYRPIAEDILFHPERVLAAIKGLLGARNEATRGARRYRNQA